MDATTITALTIICVIMNCIMTVLNFASSKSKRSVDDAIIQSDRMARIEQKIDGLVDDVKDVKNQNLETVKTETQTKERFDTLFKWKDSMEIWKSNMEKRVKSHE